MYSCCYALTEIGEYTVTISEQHFPEETNMHAITDLLLEMGYFLCDPCQDIMKTGLKQQVQLTVESQAVL
jgi:hypothetical protein